MKKVILAILIVVGLNDCKSQNQKFATESIISQFENAIYGRKSIQSRMDFYKVPAVSIAMFEKDSIIYKRAFGLKENETDNKVNIKTKFQAASISKAITALGIFKLIENHNLDLDEDINKYLKTWAVDYSQFPNREKVTIKRLLSHTAGTNVSGFQGYSKEDEIPFTIEILEGKGNSPIIKLDTIPGTKFFYSGGGFTILQKLIEDVSGKEFADFFEEQIYNPLEMCNSTFDQYPKKNISYAHSKQGKLNRDKWRVFPELAAAGLWTTPTDLAKFSIAILKSLNGEHNSIISQKSAQKLLEPVVNWSAGKYGLGVAIRGEGKNAFFWHAGSNPGGYRNIFLVFFRRNKGIIVMTNSENGAPLYNEILESYFQFQNIKL